MPPRRLVYANSLCMLIARGKKKERDREVEREEMNVEPLGGRNTRVFIAEKRRSRRCRPLAAPRTMIRARSVVSLRHSSPRGVITGRCVSYPAPGLFGASPLNLRNDRAVTADSSAITKWRSPMRPSVLPADRGRR
jgi:hypothetical protein